MRAKPTAVVVVVVAPLGVHRSTQRADKDQSCVRENTQRRTRFSSWKLRFDAVTKQRAQDETPPGETTRVRGHRSTCERTGSKHYDISATTRAHIAHDLVLEGMLRSMPSRATRCVHLVNRRWAWDELNYRRSAGPSMYSAGTTCGS